MKNGYGVLTVSLRECRMVLERLLQHAGVASGVLPAVRDCALYSAALPVGGFAGLERHLDLLRGAAIKPMRLVDGGPQLRVDCTGQHGWLVADGLLDLAVDAFRRTGAGVVIADHVSEPAELGVVEGLAERYGLTAAMVPHADGGQRLCLDLRPARRPTVLDEVRCNGVAVEAGLWWHLYEASKAALAPDSFESRRHAGTIRIEADGRIVGRNDEDETDLAMLTPDAARIAAGLR